MTEPLKPEVTAREWTEQPELAAHKMEVSAEDTMNYDPAVWAIVGAVAGQALKIGGDKIVKLLPGPWGTIGQAALGFIGKLKGKKG